MPRVLVVSDDFTGATDTGHAFAAHGYETHIQVRPGTPSPDSTIHSINTDSRYVDPRTAIGRVVDAIDDNDALVYKKVDSTLRGNVVSEVDAAMDAMNATVAVVAPAAPMLGRVTAAGYHLVDGQLITDTEYAEDPKNPTTAHLPTLFADSEHSIVYLGIETVAGGPEAVSETVMDTVSDRAIVVCDAIHQRHLETLAQAGASLDEPVLYVGSAGLAEDVPVPGDPDCEPDKVKIPNTDGGRAFGIVGSVSETTLEQLAALPDEWVCPLDTDVILTDPEQAGLRAGKRAASRLTTGEPAVVTAAPDSSAVTRMLSAGRKRDLSETAIRERVARALAWSIRETADYAGGLFVTGGDVAMAVFDALDATALQLSGNAVESGVPVGRIEDGLASGMQVVTKAGGFGHEATVVNCLRYLNSDNE
jgi:uncharacterized protein YgbK (DUF1537 family)